MRDSDAILKSLILDSANETLRQLGVGPIQEWLNVELPRIRKPRVDLVGRTGSGRIVHIEWQSRNDPDMALRMAEYALAILRQYKQYPHQFVLFVGDGKVTMKPLLETHGMRFHYDQVDIRHFDGGKLIGSAQVSDNIMAILATLDDRIGGVRQILRRIAKLRPARRTDALSVLFAAAELRQMQDTISQELTRMPVEVRTSINDKTFGPWIRKGIAQGMEKGLEKGRENTVRMALKKRFGVLPRSISMQLTGLSERDVDRILEDLLSGKALAEIFPAEPKPRRRA